MLPEPVGDGLDVADVTGTPVSRAPHGIEVGGDAEAAVPVQANFGRRASRWHHDQSLRAVVMAVAGVKVHVQRVIAQGWHHRQCECGAPRPTAVRAAMPLCANALLGHQREPPCHVLGISTRYAHLHPRERLAPLAHHTHGCDALCTSLAAKAAQHACRTRLGPRVQAHGGEQSFARGVRRMAHFDTCLVDVGVHDPHAGGELAKQRAFEIFHCG